MRICIKINCDTIADFFQHLSVIQKEIKKEAKKIVLIPIMELNKFTQK
jgi:hypothetical protein